MPLLADFRALDRRIWALAAARMIVTAGFALVLPFLPMYLTVERGFPAVVSGAIWTVAGICGAGLQWVSGEVADRVGRRPVMIASLILRAVNLVLLGWATSAHVSVWVIALLCIANSALRAFFDPAATAVIADLCAPRSRVAAYSLQRVGTNLGWAAGPALHGLAAGLSYSTMFYCSAPITLLALGALVRVRDVRDPCAPAPPARLALRDLLQYRSDRALMRVLLASGAFFVLQSQLYQTLSIYAGTVLHMTRRQVGSLYTLNGILVVCLQLPAVRWIERIGTRGALVFGSLGYAVAYAAVGLAPGPGALFLCVAAVTLAEITVAPAQQATVAALAPKGKMGAYSGLFGLCQAAGQSLGPLVGTSALDVMPPRTAWALLAGFGIAAAVGYRSGRKPLVLDGKP